MKKTLPEPKCEYGYPDKQLEEILKDRYKDFMNWMYGQTMCLCDGRRYNHEKKIYEATGCGPHGPVVYTHDLKGFLNGRTLWD